MERKRPETGGGGSPEAASVQPASAPYVGGIIFRTLTVARGPSEMEASRNRLGRGDGVTSNADCDT